MFSVSVVLLLEAQKIAVNKCVWLLVTIANDGIDGIIFEAYETFLN